MSKAVVTFGTASHAEMLEIALPTFKRFANRHGYRLLKVRCPVIARPVSWCKLPVIAKALLVHEEVLWLDADTVIVDDTEDLDVPGDAWQAMVEHRTRDGHVPNCGVWLLRRPMLPILHELWDMTQFDRHGWWEQAALMAVMGYRGRPAVCTEPSELYERTHFLDGSWNVHHWDRNPRDPHDRILHATMHRDRAATMREWVSATPSAA